MTFCRTKSGTLRVAWADQQVFLDPNGAELPDEIAENIRPHVNVIVDEKVPEPAVPEPDPEPTARKRSAKSEE